MSTRARPAVASRVTPVQHRRQTATQVDGTASVSVSMVQSRQEVGHRHRAEVVDAVRFEPGQEPAHVRVALGETIPTQPFAGVRIDVSVSLPCLPEHARETYERASELASEFLENEKQRMGV